MKSKVIKMLAATFLFVMTTGTAGAEGEDGWDVTPRVTVKLGEMGRSTVLAMNDRAVGDSDVAQNSSANTATNTATNTESNTNTNTNQSKADASASAAANVAAESTGGSGGSSSTTVDGDEAATSSAAPIFLSTGDDTCMGSSGIGVQGMDFGVSVGSSWTDENCVMLKNARELKNQGYDKAAKARLCMNEENAMAFELAGEPCPRELASTQAALAKIQAINPDYQAAAEPGPQFASTERVSTAGESVGSGDADTEWTSPKMEGFLAMVRSVVDHLTSGFGGSAEDATAMDGIE